MTRAVLIFGGAGEFGFRLAEGLAATTDLAIRIAGRDLARAEAAARELRSRHGGVDVAALRLDARTVEAGAIRATGAWLVVDAAGPFQGAAPTVASAAIAAGCHYVDLADARDFVAAFPLLDAEARRAGVLAATGASSTPALSHAVLDELTRNWRRIDRIEIAIAPGNRQTRGLSLVRAILARVGRPARVFRGGRWTEVPGWGGLVRRRVPGLGRRWLSVVETPDLDLVPVRFAPRDEAVFRASLELGVLHLGLAALSALVARGLLPDPVPLARLLRWSARRLDRLGTDRGAMTVAAEGVDARGDAVAAAWTLVASSGDGPNIPTLPALALIRKLAGGSELRGAVPCVGLLSLAEIERELARFRIVTRRRTRPRALFPRVLGSRLSLLPAAVRRGHEVDGRLVLQGRASIEGARTWPAWLIAWLFGFPGTADDVPLAVTMTAVGDEETWSRAVAGRTFRSRLSAGPRHGTAYERFGPIEFLLRLEAGVEGLDLTVVGARVGPLPLPRALLARSAARERVDAQGRFAFDVPIDLPFFGRLVRYRGWLVPERAAA